MRKSKSIIFLLFLLIVLNGCGVSANKQSSLADNEKPAPVQTADQNNENKYQTSGIDQIADRIEVYYFHRTARCYSCNTIGQYVQETMEQKYSNHINEKNLSKNLNLN